MISIIYCCIVTFYIIFNAKNSIFKEKLGLKKKQSSRVGSGSLSMEIIKAVSPFAHTAHIFSLITGEWNLLQRLESQLGSPSGKDSSP